MSRFGPVLYVNPPLWVPPDPIDYPPFAFLGALHGAAALRELGAQVILRDAFAQAPPAVESDGWTRLGVGVSEFLEQLAPELAPLVVVHFPPFARLERNLSQVLSPLLEGLSRPGRTLVLADGCLGETHYVAVDPAWLFGRFRAVDAWLAREPEKPLEALVTRRAHPRLHRPQGGGVFAPGPDRQVAQWRSGLDLCDLDRTVAWLGDPVLEPLMPGHDGVRRIFPYVASRGCPFQCSFCTSERGRRFAGQPLDRVRADLEVLRDRGVEQIWLVDAIANANRKRFVRLLDLLDELDLDLAIPNGLRMDRLDPAALTLLARRTRGVPLSMESADPEVLKSLGKKLSTDRATATLAAAADVGLPTEVHYLMGAPGESAAQVNRTLTFAFEARRRWGAEPLLQYYVPPDRMAVPADGDRGLADDFYEAFGRRPLAVEGGLSAARLVGFMDSFERKRAAPSQSKLIMNLSYRCNNECVFCSVGDRERVDGRLDHQLAALERAASQGVRLLDLDGGEPTLYPSLLPVVDRALDLGFSPITVTTNGRMLGYEGLAVELARRGVDLLISLHGASAAIHEPLTRVPGSFAQTVEGIERAREVFGRVGVNTTVVADNLSDLPALGDLLVSLGVDTWNVQLVTPFGHAIARPDLAPDWEEAVAALASLRERFSEAMTLQIVGLPLCGLGDQEDLALDDHHKEVRQMLFVDGSLVSLGAYLDERRTHDAACSGCVRRLLCGGYWDFETRFVDGHRPGPAPAPPHEPASAPPHEAAPAPPHEPAPAPPPKGAVRMVDIIGGYACNAVCDYCSVTPQMRQVNLSTAEILPTLEQGRELGVDYVSFGGGEPTIRPDILRLTRAARDLGYQTIRYQTNGFLFAYEEFTGRAVAAGLNRLHLSLMTRRADLYDRITGVPDSQKTVLRALANLRSQPVALAADLILKSDTYRHIRDTVAFYADQGVTEAYLWLVSLTDNNAAHPESLVPVSEMRPYITEALDYGRTHGLTVLSRHIPACMLPGYEDQVVRLGDEDVWVVTPRSSFWLLESVISANRFGPRCAGCTRQGVCWGLRPDYLDRYGDGEVKPYGPPGIGDGVMR
jgi:MoaA/NifB/PqqE/SkfB family radical SAM enzyme